MQSFEVAGSNWRAITILVITVGLGALLAVGCLFTPAMLVALAGWALLIGRTSWNAARSLASSEVELSWDGERLFVSLRQGGPPVSIEPALWVFSEGSNIVIRSGQRLPKFNYGHVRSSGWELTVDGFLGATTEGLSEVARQLGPAKRWLWRYMPISPG